MTTNHMKIPIGLTDAVAAIKKNIDQAHIYHRCGLKPPHYIINLDAGNGQTTLTEYIATSYADHVVRHFGGLDMFLEYTLDGSMEQLKKVFADIRACAVYTNEYEGVIAMDVSKLVNHVNETQLDVFIGEISKISSSATLVLFVPSAMNRNVATLMGRIRDALDDVEILNIKPYNPEELVEIIKGMISDAGVVMDESIELDKFFLNAVIDEHITNVKSAKKFSQLMVKNANFDGFLPKLGILEVEKSFSVGSRAKKEAK